MSAAVIAPPQLPLQRAGRFVPPKTVVGWRDRLDVSTAPAFYAACWFALGILLSLIFYEPPPVTLLIIVLSALTAGWASRQSLSLALVPVTIAWVAAGLLGGQIHPSPDPQAVLLSYASTATVTLQGEIDRAGPVRTTESTAPYASQAVREESQTIDLRVRSVATLNRTAQEVRGGVRLTLYINPAEHFRQYECGDRLQAEVMLHRPERYNDPGVWDAPAYLLKQGIGAIASAKTSSVVRLSGRAPASLACRIKALQQFASERVIGLAAAAPASSRHLPTFLSLSSEDASMLAAMITGDRTWLQRRTRIGFERTGSFHLLVVSGLHLAIFAGMIFGLAHRLRVPRLWASLLTIAAAFSYAVFTGFGQPVQRSFWMVTLYLLGRLLWRERSPLNAVGFAALCLLAADPTSLSDAGFQMTLLSVLAIAGIAAPLAERTFAPYLRATRRLSLVAIDPSLPPKVAQFRVCLRLLATHLAPLAGKRIASTVPALFIRLTLRFAELLLISVVVELVMSMPMALYFHRMTALALPANILSVPFLAFLLPAALLTFLALLVSAKLAMAPSIITAVLLHLVTGMIRTFANWSAADIRLPGPSAASIGAFLVLLGLCLFAARRRRFAVPLSLAALLSMAAAALLPRQILHQQGALEITAIDVGQGDSLLIVSPEGKTLLIDAGGSPFGPPPELAQFDIGEDVVSPYLWSRGIQRLDVIALTHTHADHIGGMPAVLANFHPRELWIGNNPHSTAYDALLHQASLSRVELHPQAAGDSFRFGSAIIHVLAPEKSYRPGPAPSNNDSLVLHIQYGQTAALLEGDAEAPSEARMIALGHLHADVLKVGHHGSRSSTTTPFLAAVSPSWALISVGARNLYGHPRMEVLRELEADHVRTFRTDTYGVATLLLDGHVVEPPTIFPARNQAIQTGTLRCRLHDIFFYPESVFSIYDSHKAEASQAWASTPAASP